ncbi:MAG: insulinase family protein [Desulfobacterales bacterium]|nr:insulinase family protein [Desulfobacterales bacterium]
MPKKTVLPNGIRIVSKKMAHVRSVSMGVWVDVGARDESEHQSGLSHFIEHMIFKGTARRSAYQIAKEFDAIGGHTNAFTSMENTCYHAKVMDSHLTTMVEILSDIFLNSAFDPQEVERERPVILQEIGMVEDSPEEFLHVLAGRNYWGDHPLGRSILGSREHIAAYSADTIREFFHRFYHPERIIVAVAGNVEHERIVELIGPSFATIHNGQPLPERTVPQVQPKNQTHKRRLEQVHLCLTAPGISITDPRRFAFSLLNAILGGNMSSRLFQEIREKRGLAYSVYSFMMSHVDTGMFGVYAGVSAANVSQTMDLIRQGLERLIQAPVSAEELRDAKEYTKGNLLLSDEGVDNQMVRIAQNDIHFGRFVPLDDVVKKIEAVQAEEIQSLARALFQPEQSAWTLLGPVKEKRTRRVSIPSEHSGRS